MLGFIEFGDFAVIELFLFGIPESVGLLAFGVGLTATAVGLRRLLGLRDARSIEVESLKID